MVHEFHKEPTQRSLCNDAAEMKRFISEKRVAKERDKTCPESGEREKNLEQKGEKSVEREKYWVAGFLVRKQNDVVKANKI